MTTHLESRFDAHEKKPGVLYVWYSICSRHGVYEPRCAMCDAGHWVFEPSARMSRLAFKIAPNAWRRWANRG